MIILASNIIKSFNSVIADFIKDGYVISPLSMKGSYTSAESFVDLIHGDNTDHIIRVWLCENSMTPVATSYRYIRTKSIVVKKYDLKNKANINDISWPSTLWPNEGILTKEIKYYEFANRGYQSVYTDSLDEATSYFNIQSDRRSRRYTNFNYQLYRKDVSVDKLPVKFVSNIMNRIHEIRGFKRATKDCINKVTVIKENGKFKSTVQYSFNGKSGSIYLH